jgi:hypothetical protein
MHTTVATTAAAAASSHSSAAFSIIAITNTVFAELPNLAQRMDVTNIVNLGMRNARLITSNNKTGSAVYSTYCPEVEKLDKSVHPVSKFVLADQTNECWKKIDVQNTEKLRVKAKKARERRKVQNDDGTAKKRKQSRLRSSNAANLAKRVSTQQGSNWMLAPSVSDLEKLQTLKATAYDPMDKGREIRYNSNFFNDRAASNESNGSSDSDESYNSNASLQDAEFDAGEEFDEDHSAAGSRAPRYGGGQDAEDDAEDDAGEEFDEDHSAAGSRAPRYGGGQDAEEDAEDDAGEEFDEDHSAAGSRAPRYGGGQDAEEDAEDDAGEDHSAAGSRAPRYGGGQDAEEDAEDDAEDDAGEEFDEEHSAAGSRAQRSDENTASLGRTGKVIYCSDDDSNLEGIAGQKRKAELITATDDIELKIKKKKKGKKKKKNKKKPDTQVLNNFPN